MKKGWVSFGNSAADAYRKWSDARWREIDKDARGDAGDGVVAGDSDFDNRVITSTELPHFPAGDEASRDRAHRPLDDPVAATPEKTPAGTISVHGCSPEGSGRGQGGS